MNLIKPMEPNLSEKIINDDQWIHQIKWDGIRGLTYYENNEVRIFTKSGRERTIFYPEIHTIKELVDARQVILDGEIVVFNEQGNPNFQSILARERSSSTKNIQYYTKKYPIKYIVFDILAIDGKDLTKTPLYERKAILIKSLQQNHTIGITDDFTNGEKLFNLIKEKGWEGIVSKRINSLYFPGKDHNEWYKVKVNRKMLAVLGGIQWRDNYPNSLLLGIYRENQLIYIGKASIGLKQADILLLKNSSDQLSSPANPFTNQVTDTNIKNVTWFQPLITCWVQFLEWTNDGHLRHPKILGFSSEKPFEATGGETIV